MYNIGDHILFAMKGRIIDTIYDPEYGNIFIVSVGNQTFRVPEANIQQVFEHGRQPVAPRRPIPPRESLRRDSIGRAAIPRSPYEQGSAGCGGIPEQYRRPPSPNPCYVDGFEQTPPGSPRVDPRIYQCGHPRMPDFDPNDLRRQEG